ncbi:spondin domain-containing protein [Cytophaga aurantiaca]|uniref:spondin domain-containing protein n=1 Tax=Cytophaga aurantiaca TaxID=29530 RepID=UPI00036E2B78|nr:spondin domain-containing protein [Cytophaga aurantiaca]
MNKVTLLTILFSAFSIIQGICQTSATYDITFTSTWNTIDHNSLPVGAHWSKLVGATHKTENAFFQVGSLATTGIKNIAELGNNIVFNSEVQTAITNNEANQYIDGSGLASATGDIVISNLVVSSEFPLLTLASMVAPSPDWFTGINGINLLDANSNWKTSVTIDLYVYDTGTDSGTDYASANSITNPFQPISMINGLPFQGNKVGTITITLKTVLAIQDASIFNNVKVFPNPVSDGKITISEIGDISAVKIDILSAIGTYMLSVEVSGNQNTFTIDTQSLPPGTYILKLTTEGNSTLVRKIVII